MKNKKWRQQRDLMEKSVDMESEPAEKKLDIQADPEIIACHAVGDKVIMCAVIQDENGISMDENMIMGEYPIEGTIFDKNSQAYAEAMASVKAHMPVIPKLEPWVWE